MLLNCGVGEDSQEFQPVHPKGNQSWIYTGRTDVEAETPILWPPDAKSWLIWKDPDAGKDWRRKEKGMTEDEMVGWHDWLNGHEFEWTLGVGDGQGGLACCSPWVTKSWTQLSNWTKLNSNVVVTSYLLLLNFWSATPSQSDSTPTNWLSVGSVHSEKAGIILNSFTSF